MKLRSLAILIMALAAMANASASVLFFTSPSCGPCIEMKPAIEQVKQVGITVVEHNLATGWGRTLAEHYGVMATPTCVIVDASGAAVSMLSGKRTAAEVINAARGAPTLPTGIKWDFTPRASYHQAAVKVDGGSGVYVELADGTTGILTAAHVGSSPIVWSDGTTNQFDKAYHERWNDKNYHDAAGGNTNYDVAFITAYNPNIRPLRFSATPPQVGDQVEVMGFGGPREELRHYRGRVERIDQVGKMKLTCAVAAGDSGGAILNSRHEVISVVSTGDTTGFDNGEARAYTAQYVPRYTPVRDFLARLVETLGGRKAPPHGMKPAPDTYRGWYPPKEQQPQPAQPIEFPPQPEPEPDLGGNWSGGPRFDPPPAPPGEYTEPTPQPLEPPVDQGEPAGTVPPREWPEEPTEPSRIDRIRDKVDTVKSVGGTAAKVYPWVSFLGPILGGGIAAGAGFLVTRWKGKDKTPSGGQGGPPADRFR